MSKSNLRVVGWISVVLFAVAISILWQQRTSNRAVIKDLPDLGSLLGTPEQAFRLKSKNIIASSLDLPFVGRVASQALQVIANSDDRNNAEEPWTVYLSKTGVFLGADYTRAEFISDINAGLSEDRHKDLDERIDGVPITQAKIGLMKLKENATEETLISNPPIVLDQVRIRRVIMTRGNGRLRSFEKKEVYIMTLWGDGIMPSVSNPEYAGNIMRMVYDENGKIMYADSGP